jgi:uncharacterized protein YukE
MIPSLRYITVLRTFHPPEADELANECSSCARQVDSYRQETDRLIIELFESWSGHQNDVFMESISKAPARLEYIAGMFDSYAETFHGLQVTVEETVPAAP